MLIGGDSNEVITLGRYFSMFAYIRARFRFALIGGNLTAQSTVDGEPQANWTWNSNSRDRVASSPSFSRPAARAPRRACSQDMSAMDMLWFNFGLILLSFVLGYW